METETLTEVPDPKGFLVKFQKVFYLTSKINTYEVNAYSLVDGGFIGDINTAIGITSLGIIPQKAKDKDEACSIGFNENEQKWYGYSHRGYFGFGIGDSVEDGDFRKLPGFTAKTLDDCKKIAIAYVDAVS